MRQKIFVMGKEALAEAGVMTSTVTLSLGTIILLVALIIRITAF